MNVNSFLTMKSPSPVSEPILEWVPAKSCNPWQDEKMFCMFQLHNIYPSIGQIIAISITATAASIGAAGIPQVNTANRLVC